MTVSSAFSGLYFSLIPPFIRSLRQANLAGTHRGSPVHTGFNNEDDQLTFGLKRGAVGM